MLILDEPDLTEVFAGFAALACIPHDAAWVDPPVLTLPVGFVPGENAAIAQSIIPATVDTGTATIPLPDDQRVVTITRQGQTYTPAIDTADPQPGEYVVQGDEAVVYGDFAPDAAFEVQTQDEVAAIANPLITSLAALPDIFQRYELQGVVEWSQSFEGHPTASFELYCTWAEVAALKAELRPNKRTQFVLFGIGFEVEGLTVVKEGLLTHPDRTATIKVELRGKWESYLDQQIVLDADADVVSSGNRTIRGNTTVGAIAAKVGAIAVLPPNTIYAPREANQEQILSLEEAFTGQLRHNGLFADYDDPTAIRAIALDSTLIHQVLLDDVASETLEIAIAADPRAVEYENSPLEWGNSIPEPTAAKEDTQGDKTSRPQWRMKPPERKVTITGAASLNQPVGVVETKDVLKLNFDGGGPVREQKTVYTENGATMQINTVKWGFAGTSHQHVYSYDSGSGKWSASNLASLPWVKIEETSQSFSYDGSTGYLGSVRLTGWRLARLKSESNNEALDAYSAWAKAPPSKTAAKLRLLKAYEYRLIPVVEVTTYGTTTLRSRYNDIPPEPTEEYQIEEPKFLPDGRLNPVRSTGKVEEFDKDGQPYYRLTLQQPVPGWTDPQYVAREYTLRSAYLSEPNPESTDKKPLPDMTTGESKEVDKSVFVPSYKDRPKPPTNGASGTVTTVAMEVAETFIVSEFLSNQLESGFARSAKDNTQTRNSGRPGEHTRKVPQYEKIDPTSETDPTQDGDPTQDEYEWRITTRETTDPLYIGDDRVVGDSISYPYAASFDQAMVALKTDLDIQNTAATETLDIEVAWLVGFPMRPGDRINLEEHGIWRILGTNKSMEIVAPGMCQPANVQLSLGKLIPVPSITTRRVRVSEAATETADPAKTQPLGLNGEPITDPRALIGYGLGNPNGV